MRMSKMKIREITDEDSDFLLFLYLKRESRDILTPIIPSEQHNFIKHYLLHDDITPFQSWYVIEVGGTKIGSLTLHKHNNELGFWIIEEFQGKGYGSRAVQEFIKINDKSFYTIKSHIENSKSNSLAKKLNFRLTHNYYTLNL